MTGVANYQKYDPKYKKRVCLKCNKKFWSIGPNNRICKRCNVINLNIVKCNYFEEDFSGGLLI